MASSIGHDYFVCHFCFNKFHDYSFLISHIPECHSKNSIKRNEETIRPPRLNKLDRDLLQMLKLHRFNDKSIPRHSKDTTNADLLIPLSMDSIVSSKQSSFDDSICSTNNSLLLNGNNPQIDEENIPIYLNTKSSSLYHTYKYSRREQKHFYASVKRARLKKQNPNSRRLRLHSYIFNQGKNIILLPTMIFSRQRLNTNSNNSYPLIFDPNFNTLVQKSTNHLLENYSSNIDEYFHLLHSIASQEFQTIVNSNDNQHQVSYTAFSFLNLLRQTMTDYSISLQKNSKRNYFQSFQIQPQQPVTTFRIPTVSSSSSSSQIHVENNNNHHQRIQIPIARIRSSTPIVENFIPVQQNHMDVIPVQSELMLIDDQQPTDRPIITSFIPIIEEQKSNRSASPILLKKQKLEPMEIDESSLLPPPPSRLRLINGSNTKSKSSSSSSRKKGKPIDDNSLIKATRMSTRQNTIKTEPITELPLLLSFETKPVILSSNQISKEWLTHTVFYRCHACSHEQFFVGLSRECMNLHLSSDHANMQENFKQRLSNFLTHKGRSLKIFQHYLKWQQPWSEKQVEQIFKLSNK